MEIRVHQEIGQQQQLIYFHQYSPGCAFFLPHGTRIYNRLMDFLRKEYRKRGFEEVISPNMFHCELWKKSGHWDKYKENMFVLQIDEDNVYSLKPMNCPGHCLIYASQARSYRDLPLRLADFGVLHRNELSGALRGLTRVRRFCQDDAHIFCREDQIEEEIEKCLDFLKYVYSIFKFPVVNNQPKVECGEQANVEYNQNFFVELSTRPEKYIGSIDTWNYAENCLENVLKKLKINYQINKGDGAFYGPKIDIHINDALGRSHQCGTIQLDFNLSSEERFNLEYATSVPGVKQRPVIIHRAILGSFERFIAILMEHTQGYWPLWLSPRQLMIIPIRHNQYAMEVQQRLLDLDFYVDLDESDDTLEKKIVNAELLQYNYIIVVGSREEKDRTVSLRSRDRKQEVLSLDDCINRLYEEVRQFK